ncbi:MAG: hypothetical protein Q9227_002692 [Pyrenula ochraceoflavens]
MYALTLAKELFIRYLTEQAHNVVKSERKPRRNLQYRDFANAVSRIDNLEFLSDTIPQTTTYRKFKEKKARDAANGVPTAPGQRTIDGSRTQRAPDVVENGEGSSLTYTNGNRLPNGDGIPDGYVNLASPTSPAFLVPVNGPSSPVTERAALYGHPSGGDVEMAD